MTAQYKRFVQAAGVLIAAVSLYTIGYQLWKSWEQLQGVQINVAPALLALVFGILALTIYGILWRSMLLRFGESLSLVTAIRIWFTSQIVRYAPGNVWHVLGRVYLAKQEGISAQPSGLSMVFELLQTITAGLLVAALSLLFWQQHTIFELATLLLIPLMICYMWPQLLQRPVAWMMQRIRVPPSPIILQRSDLFALLPGYCLTWISYGCGLYVLTRSIYPLPLAHLPTITGIFAIAWVLGFLSFITPSGLGVREGILSYMLGSIMPLPVALLMAILARIWLTLAELGCVALVIWKRKRVTTAEQDRIGKG